MNIVTEMPIKKYLDSIKSNFLKYDLIIIPCNKYPHWWVNVFVKVSSKEYMIITLDSLNGNSKNSIIQIKKALQYFESPILPSKLLIHHQQKCKQIYIHI